MKIPKKVKTVFRKTGYFIRKNAPAILTGASITLGGISVYEACKATLSTQEYKDEFIEERALLQEMFDSEDTNIPKNEQMKELAILYSKTGIKYLKKFGPAIVCGAASIGCNLASLNIMSVRNWVLATSLAGIQADFGQYRERVRDKYGEEIEDNLYYGVTQKKYSQTVIDPETGKKKKENFIADEKAPWLSFYARLFDESNPNYTLDPYANRQFLMNTCRLANEILKQTGHMSLNELLKMLGWDPWSEGIDVWRVGEQVGWIYDSDDTGSDSYIDIGIKEINAVDIPKWIEGTVARSIWLDFNCVPILVTLK